MNKKTVIIALVVLVVVGVGAYIVGLNSGSEFQPGAVKQLSTETAFKSFDGGFRVGSSGTKISSILAATTTLIGSGSSAYSIVASTTEAVDFTCTGVTSQDLIRVFFQPTSTPTTIAQTGWSVKYAKASTTADKCTAYIHNGTGATANISADFASSTAYEAIRLDTNTVVR